MSFELIINQRSRIARLCLVLLIAFCVLLTMTAIIALPIKIVVVVMFVVVYFIWRMRQPDHTKLTFDGMSWYIDSPQGVFSAARLQSVRSFLWCRVFDFIDEDGDHYRQVIWQDQVSVDMWRRLAVFNTLHSYRQSYY